MLSALGPVKQEGKPIQILSRIRVNKWVNLCTFPWHYEPKRPRHQEIYKHVRNFGTKCTRAVTSERALYIHLLLVKKNEIAEVP